MKKSSHLNKQKLTEILKKSYSPYSSFPVAAQVVSSEGESFFGCNVENSSYGGTLCAERAAITSMITQLGPNTKVQEVHIISEMTSPITPCGICRQFIYEFALPETHIFCYSSDFETSEVFQIDEIFPRGFKL